MGRFFAAFLILCGALSASDRSAVAQVAAAPTGSLFLSTLPSGADVWLDGAYVGTSPVLVDALSVGRHSLSVSRAGWSVKEIEVDISEQVTAMESLRLERSTARVVRATGTLALRGISGNYHAWIDGVSMGSAAGAAAIVPVGQHSLVVQSARGKMTRHVTIYPDMTTNVVLREGPESHAPTVLMPLDVLSEANVVIEKPNFAIKYGAHTVSGALGSEKMIFDGSVMWVDVAPTLIGGKLYIPQGLVKKLTGQTSKSAARG